ncbi:MAG: PilZ domain-containing protein [Nitrospirae bacterium]|nr:PilZ domain-containing protein [Nitrospirota bacterium]
MNKRLYERIAVSEKVEVRFLLGNMIYPGVISDISENGMFIGTNLHPLVGSEVDVVVLLPTKEVLKFPVRIRRAKKPGNPHADYSGHNHNGVGVELLEPPQAYKQFVNDLKSVYI